MEEIPKVRPKYKGGVSKKTENPEWQQSIVKRVCKDIDITDKTLVLDAIGTYMAHHQGRKLNRRKDIKELYKTYKTNDAIADELIRRIRARDLDLDPVRVVVKLDGSNGKERIIGLEGVWQQLFDQIATDGLKPLTKRIGEYQCTCLKNQPKRIYHKTTHEYLRTEMIGRGQVWAKDAAYGWMHEDDTRYIVQMDIRKNYASVDQTKLMEFLRKHVRNEPLLWLVQELLKTVPGGNGLIIGSVLSITLDALYISQLYHHLMEDTVRYRKHKNGSAERIRLVKHLLIWMDDINIFTASEKNAKMAANECIRYCKELGLEIKPGWKIIKKNDPRICPRNYVDIVGYKVYPDRVTMRRKDYINMRRAFKHARKRMDLKTAYRIISYKGFLINCDSYRFRKKYGTKKLLRKARRLISKHDKSTVHSKTARNKVHRDRRHDVRTDMPS